MQTRRNFVKTVSLVASGCVVAAQPQAQPTSSALSRFEEGLLAVRSDPLLVENTHAFRELNERLREPTELGAQPQLHHTFSSTKEISEKAKSLIIVFEVSGEQQYKSKYQAPTWPKGDSGLTIGVGYDLGYVTQADFEEDWGTLLPANVVARLKTSCGIKSTSAAILPAQNSDIKVSWEIARSQFYQALSMIAGETQHAFLRSSELSADSFGALVSLVYNRGSALKGDPSDHDDRRREMRTIKTLLINQMFSEVPAQIRSMKRLWLNNPDAKGLLTRRDLEADLFEAGLT